jgi:4-hydroxy-3-methylbut-2-enyl diphosphate reductase
MKFSDSMVNEKKLNLQAEIDERSGFCFGVINAIKKAEELLDKGEKVYCVGQIVHNDEEVKRLFDKGLQTIDHKQLRKLEGQNILFRAHGEPPESYELAREHNNVIVDASCPIILKLQRDVHKAWKNGENIYLFGKHNHPEIIGLSGQTNNEAAVFESLEELKEKQIPDKLTLFSQTTKSLKAFYDVIEYLENKRIDVKVKDTICRQVSNREHELKEFSRTHDKIVFIAGKHSSNGKVLYEVCKSINPQSYFITSPKEIKPEWFINNEFIGICGATSTPQWQMEQVKEAVEAL